MIAATGVSRTVIREAVAALRADRLVVTRQGVGAFVADQVRRPFRVDFDERSPLREVLNVMELRTGVEDRSRRTCRRACFSGAGQKDRRPVRCNSGGHRQRRERRRRGFRISLCDRRRHRQPTIHVASSNISAVSSSRAARSGRRSALPRRSRPTRNVPEGTRADTASDRRARGFASARQAMQRHLLNSRQRYERLAAEHGPE